MKGSEARARKLHATPAAIAARAAPAPAPDYPAEHARVATEGRFALKSAAVRYAAAILVGDQTVITEAYRQLEIASRTFAKTNPEK